MSPRVQYALSQIYSAASRWHPLYQSEVGLVEPCFGALSGVHSVEERSQPVKCGGPEYVEME